MAESVKRRYRSPRRDAAAAATRARIREAATAAFVEHGYAATTLREVARRAGVGERTLYDSFGGKSGLFSHALDVAVAGDEEPVPVAERPEVLAAGREADAALALERMVDYTVGLLERAGDLIMVSVEAAGADPDMRAAARAGSEATHRVQLEFARALARTGSLRPAVDAETAADVLYTLLSPHTHQLLRRHRGWSVERYRRWLHATVRAQLLASA